MTPTGARFNLVLFAAGLVVWTVGVVLHLYPWDMDLRDGSQRNGMSLIVAGTIIYTVALIRMLRSHRASGDNSS